MPGDDELEELRQTLLGELGADLSKVALRQGEALFRQGDPADAIYLVVSGRLQVSHTRVDGGELAIAEIGPGEPVGELAILTGGRRSASVVALEPTELLELPREGFERLTGGSPQLIPQLAGIVRRRLLRTQLAAALPRLLGPLDAGLLRDVEQRVEWVHLAGGDTLFREGDVGDALYILLSGRVRVVARADEGEERVLNEIAPGETIGEMALITGEARSATVHAIRDCTLARLSAGEFERLSRAHPRLLMGIARLLTARLRRREGSAAIARPMASLALVPASPGVPLGEFAARLAAALAAAGPTLHLTAERFDSFIGIPGAARIPPDGPRGSRLGAWLDEQETRYRFLVFEAEPTLTPWTRRCIRQADQILLVADAAADPAPGEVESSALAPGRGAGARRILVLLHSQATRLPAGTSRWLAARHVDAHYHVRVGDERDVARVARSVTGRGIGVALGGGGARGLAHIGVLRALSEAGVPIDMIAGTSMGALIAAAHAAGMGYEALLDLGRTVLIEGRPHKEYTLPVMSLIRSRRLDRLIHMTYRDMCIEDLWLPFFCISCNLTTTDMEVHRRGLVWKAVRASSAIPGVFLPVIEGRDLLVDGGVLNNLPGDLLRRFSCARVMVVEVNPQAELAFERPDFPSPWRVLKDKFLSPSRPLTVPTIFEIIMRTIDVSSNRRAREVRDDADFCFEPPVKRFGPLHFEALREIAEVGYAYGREKVAELLREEWASELIGPASSPAP